MSEQDNIKYKPSEDLIEDLENVIGPTYLETQIRIQKLLH